MIHTNPSALRRGRRGLRVLFMVVGLAAAGGAAVAADAERDHEHHELTITADNTPYRFSPGDPVNEATLIQASVRYPGEIKGGLVAWELAVYTPDHRLVRSYYGRAYLPPLGQVTIAQPWDGRDPKGRPLPPGEYPYEITVHYVPDTSPAMAWVPYEQVPLLFRQFETDGVRGSARIVPPAGAATRPGGDRNSAYKAAAAPLDPRFALNFYYGNFHSQSNYSDGGWAVSGGGSCNRPESGQLCQGQYSPAESFLYARYAGGLDFLAVTDHNHLFDCSSYYSAAATYTCRMEPDLVLAKYQTGLAWAQLLTEDQAFVAIYGMEFGVTSQPTDGHIGVLESPWLFNWEEHQNGPCYDIYVGRSQYADLYTALVNFPSPWGPMAILNHPGGTREFNSYELNEAAVDAVVGIEVVNGPAFSESETMGCNGTRYDGDSVFCQTACRPACALSCTLPQHQYMWALNKGFRAAPFASQDNHHHNFGASTPNRTVVMAAALTKDDLMYAVRQRHVFATSRDPDAQLVFITDDGTYMMGDAFTATSPVSFHTSIRHPDGRDIIDELRVYIGYPGTTRTPSLARTSRQSTYDFSLTFTPGRYYVFIYVKQTDGSELWSAPMWITVE